MRLIDADNLKPTEGMFIYQTKDRDTVVAVEAYRWELIEREAPTVKAIPMGWISEYSRRPLSNADYWAIMRMVTAWEKENANNN